ncbi:hypothetical protein HW555_004967 [Spodoptera exigua]|uniref:C2H2-type domain-containing protein n=1 Tax=Spodoptera exigua TaxID=7107 RepID=A0A835GLG9_SPOEX|nr:hypothetical protein HW555_004967 [Spodoptera exigua]
MFLLPAETQQRRTFYSSKYKMAPVLSKNQKIGLAVVMAIGDSISAKQRLVVTLRFLATGNSYQDLKYSSLISQPMLSIIIPETCSAIYTCLEHYIKKTEAVVIPYRWYINIFTPCTEEVFKNELDNSSRISFCQACLSSDRSLFRVDEDEFFKNILGMTLPPPILICWECLAIVKKIKSFKAKVEEAQRILAYHYSNNQSVGPYECETCHAHFENETALSNHARSHNFAWECIKCGYQCYSVRRLNHHVKCHRSYQCVYCDAEFQDVSSFYVHYKSLHSVFLCDHCGKRCKTKYMLEKHMSRHSDSHVCSTCSRKYKSRAALRKHYALKHSTCAAEQAYCVLCDKQVKKKYPCPECSNIYSRRAYMMNHYRHVHMNQSKYYCGTCERHFLNRTRYIDHMRYNHEGVKKEKNKLCNICGRGFAANRTLLNHMRTHSGERPYECEYCSSKFTQRTSMLSHVKYIHLKSKRGQEWQH